MDWTKVPNYTKVNQIPSTKVMISNYDPGKKKKNKKEVGNYDLITPKSLMINEPNMLGYMG